MKKTATVTLTSAVLAMALFATAAPSAYAASDMNNHMTKHQMRMMKKCHMMSHDAMMHNQRCMKMMGMKSGM